MPAIPGAGSRLALDGLAARRAVPALLVGLVVPFVQLHSAAVGLWAFTVFAGLTAAALASARTDVPARPGTARQRGGSWPVQLAVWSALASLAALLGALLTPTAAVLGLTAGLWGVGAALIEGRAWWSMRDVGQARAVRIAKDWRTAAILTLAFGLSFLFVRDDVTLTGLLGAYAVILGVFLIISALSQSPAPRRVRARSRA